MKNISTIKSSKVNDCDIILVDNDEVGLYFLLEKKLYLYEDKPGIIPDVLKEISVVIRERYGSESIISIETLESVDDVLESMESGREERDKARNTYVLTLDEWFDELKDLAMKDFGFTQEAVDSMEKRDYKEYYDEGYTSLEALEEDLSYADI